MKIIYDTYMPEIVVTPNKPMHFSGHTFSEAWNQDTKDRKVLNSFKPSATGPLMRGAVPFFAPLMIPGLAAGIAAIAPGTAGGTMVGQAAASMGAGELLNKASEIVTGNSFGQNVSNLTGGYVSPEGGDFLNPGYLFGGKYFTKGIQEALNLTKQGLNWTNRNYIRPYRLSRVINKASDAGISDLGQSILEKQFIDNQIRYPNNSGRFIHMDHGDNYGYFSDSGAFVKDNKLYPGQTIRPDEQSGNFIWFGENKPYGSNGTIKEGVPITPIGGFGDNSRIIVVDENAGDIFRVRGSNRRIGQWPGLWNKPAKGPGAFVKKDKFVSEGPVDLSRADVYTKDPLLNIWGRTKYYNNTENPTISTIDFNTARTVQKNKPTSKVD